MKLLTALTFTLASTAAFAHHGSNGQFNRDIKVEVTGVITNVRMVNPHSWVYFDVIGEAGETQEWRCELRGSRSGWTKEMFPTGTSITMKGSQARREEFGCMMETIIYADGRILNRDDQIAILPDVTAVAEVELAPGTPVISGRWAAPPGRGHTPGPSEAAAKAAAWPSDIPVPKGRVQLAATPAGIAAVGDFSIEMNPRLQCEETNIFHDWSFDGQVNKIEQTDDKIIMTYGFMNLVRTIHLDMASHPDNIIPSRAGHSIGKWEGDTLVVDTVGFEAGWLAAVRSGIKHSDQMHTVEKFDLSDDGQWLVMTYTINDPLYLEKPHTAQLTQNKTNDPYSDYACLELTEERVKGF